MNSKTNKKEQKYTQYIGKVREKTERCLLQNKKVKTNSCFYLRKSNHTILESESEKPSCCVENMLAKFKKYPHKKKHVVIQGNAVKVKTWLDSKVQFPDPELNWQGKIQQAQVIDNFHTSMTSTAKRKEDNFEQESEKERNVKF